MYFQSYVWMSELRGWAGREASLGGRMWVAAVLGIYLPPVPSRRRGASVPGADTH